MLRFGPAKELFETRGVADRVELAPGSFFETVPRGCDGYILKNILHDWSDDTSKKILGVVRAAAKPGAKALLCEMLVDYTSTDYVGTRSDLQMMVACHDGRERSLEDLQLLLDESGFAPGRVFRTALGAVVEGVAR